MKKKTITGFALVAFVCLFLFFVTSCAEKEVQVSETIQPTAEELAAIEAQKTKEAEEAAEKVRIEELRAEQLAEEAARQAKLQEEERARQLAAKVSQFEATSIYFAFDKANLTAESEEILKVKAEYLQSNPSYSLVIEGNCDERGTNEYNLALGERRAHSAKKFLTALGISADRMSTISYGEERPVDPGHNETAWSKNRRDDFRLVK